MTHTFVFLDISSEAYNEIKRKLEDAGYQHTFLVGGGINMHGLALRPMAPKSPARASTYGVVLSHGKCPHCLEEDTPLRFVYGGILQDDYLACELCGEEHDAFHAEGEHPDNQAFRE